MEFKHLSQEDIEQNEIDFHNFMSAESAGRNILDEMEYFGAAFYDNNESFI